jgi:hypothetical protein
MMTDGSIDPEAQDKSRLPDSAVTDFRSDYGGPARIGSWAFAVIVMALVAGCGWAYQVPDNRPRKHCGLDMTTNTPNGACNSLISRAYSLMESQSKAAILLIWIR